MYKSHKVSFKSYASYISLNILSPKTKNIWIIFHGYGQLSKFFIRRFDILDKKENYIIAPQGLSKFYTDKDYQNVGASWLTLEDKNIDFKSQLSYLNSVIADISRKIKINNYKINLFGFSQGVSTLCRLTQNIDFQIDNIIMWAGWIPSEFFNLSIESCKNSNFIYVMGKKDKYFDLKLINEYKNEFIKKKYRFNYELFNGEHKVDRKVLKKINEEL